MFTPFSRYRLGFLLYVFILLTGFILTISIPKFELHLLMNAGHSAGLDVFFHLLTWLGDGWFAVLFAFVFLPFRIRYFLMILFSFSISGLLVQFFKRIVFPDVLRPSAYLDRMPGLELVQGVDLHSTFSFPSGHTTTAFAILVLAGLILRNRILFFISVLLAWSVAFSRVYLSQHFLADVLAGSVTGLLSALFFYWYFRRFKNTWLDQSLWRRVFK